MNETTTRPATGTEAVAAGVAWLNEQAPGWRAQVDLAPDAFDIEDPFSCVLAQVSRGQGWYNGNSITPYSTGVDRASIADDYIERRDWAQDHGFVTNWSAVDRGDDTWSSPGLTAAWRAQLGV